MSKSLEDGEVSSMEGSCTIPVLPLIDVGRTGRLTI
jgi:hypothetical protein